MTIPQQLAKWRDLAEVELIALRDALRLNETPLISRDDVSYFLNNAIARAEHRMEKIERAAESSRSAPHSLMFDVKKIEDTVLHNSEVESEK